MLPMINQSIALLFALVCYVQGQVTTQWPTNSTPASVGAYYNGNVLTINWAAMSGGPSDLWIAATEGNYRDRLASNVMVDRIGSYAWKIAVGVEEIDARHTYQLYFIPTGEAFDAQAVASYNAGPQFQLFNPGEVLSVSTGSSTPTGSSIISVTFSGSGSDPTSMATVLTSDPPASTRPATVENTQSGLSTGAKAGISVGIVLAALIVLGLLLWALRLRRKVKAATNHRSSGIVPTSGVIPEKSNVDPIRRVSGVHEVAGDRRQPVEMQATRKTVYHELAG